MITSTLLPKKLHCQIIGELTPYLKNRASHAAGIFSSILANLLSDLTITKLRFQNTKHIIVYVNNNTHVVAP